MVLKEISYFVDGKKHKVKAKICKSFFCKGTGLMFRKNSPPLFFIFNKNKKIDIHSFFCVPFKAIWLDEKMNATRVIDVKDWKINISGRGKYLLEVPKNHWKITNPRREKLPRE